VFYNNPTLTLINDYSYDIEINKNVDKTLNELNDTTLNMMILGKSGVGKVY